MGTTFHTSCTYALETCRIVELELNHALVWKNHLFEYFNLTLFFNDILTKLSANIVPKNHVPTTVYLCGDPYISKKKMLQLF